MKSKVRVSAWSQRSCPICDRADLLVALGKRKLDVRQRTETFRWKQTDGVCSGCGLIQSLEAPESDFLTAYYADAYTTRASSEQIVVTPGFNVEARLSSIEKFHHGGRVVEVGAGDGKFCEVLRDRGIDVAGFDPLSDQDSELVGIGYAASASWSGPLADTVIAYHVLEHAADPLQWLRVVASILKSRGVLIVEVPDVDHWPVEAWHHEHFTQFSRGLLQVLSERAGFETISCGVEEPSREHGVVYVGRLAKSIRSSQPVESEQSDPITHAAELYSRAERIRRDQVLAAGETASRVLAARASNSANKSQVIIWGANEIASGIAYAMSETHQDLTVRVVDNAASKTGVPHAGFMTPVEPPVFERDNETFLIFVLCSRAWNAQIKGQIEEMGLLNFIILDGTNWPSQ